jgi:hypothetical protein
MTKIVRQGADQRGQRAFFQLLELHFLPQSAIICLKIKANGAKYGICHIFIYTVYAIYKN